MSSFLIENHQKSLKMKNEFFQLCFIFNETFVIGISDLEPKKWNQIDNNSLLDTVWKSPKKFRVSEKWEKFPHLKSLEFQKKHKLKKLLDLWDTKLNIGYVIWGHIADGFPSEKFHIILSIWKLGFLGLE